MHVSYKADATAVDICFGNTFFFLLKIVITSILVLRNGIVQ